MDYGEEDGEDDVDVDSVGGARELLGQLLSI